MGLQPDAHVSTRISLGGRRQNIIRELTSLGNENVRLSAWAYQQTIMEGKPALWLSGLQLLRPCDFVIFIIWHAAQFFVTTFDLECVVHVG